MLFFFSLNGINKQDGLETKSGYNPGSTFHYESCGLSHFSQQSSSLGCWKICRIPLVLSMSVLPSYLWPALPSGLLLSLLSLAMSIMLFPPWLDASLPNMLFSAQGAPTLFTGAA